MEIVVYASNRIITLRKSTNIHSTSLHPQQLLMKVKVKVVMLISNVDDEKNYGGDHTHPYQKIQEIQNRHSCEHE